MENDERWCSNGNILQGLNVPASGQLIDPANVSNSNINRATTVRQRLSSNSTVPQTQANMVQRSRIGSDFVNRISDDEMSNLSSCYDDRSSFSSEDIALRDRGNEEQQVQKMLVNESFVPEVGQASVLGSETGYFTKVNGDSSGTIADDDYHQQVPVSKYEELELRILRQPEEQHRARYMSEGSRGSVKDRSGKSHCTVALRGYYRPAVLEIFAAVGSGAPIPHPLYRLIPVTGKNGSSVTSCKEGVTVDGAQCLQVVLRPENKMTALLDCIGILKICSYDLKRKLPKQNRSASVRLVFRVTVPSPRDRRQNVTLQTISLPIVCAQQPGYPDVSRVSCTSASVQGNVDVFIVGKNFSNNATVMLKEYGSDGKLVWSAPAVVDQQHIHTCHMICTVPPYRDLYTNKCVEVMLTVECGKKLSRPLPFKYLPNVSVATPVQGQQSVTYNGSYTLDSLSAAPSSGQQVQQQALPKYDEWTTTSFNAPVQQQYQQPQQQQQIITTMVNEQQAFANAPTTLPAVTTASNMVEFVDTTSKPEPVLDEQNASFYYSNQFNEKTPTTKRNNDVFMTTDPFTFALEDFPQLLT